MGPYQRSPKQLARAIGYSGLVVCSIGPVGDFLEYLPYKFKPSMEGKYSSPIRRI